MSIRTRRTALSRSIFAACCVALSGAAVAQVHGPSSRHMPQKSEVLDCARLANSAMAEPAGYADQCLPYAPSYVQPLGPVPQDPTDPGFKYDMRDNVGLYSYVLNDFAGQTFVGNPGDAFYAWDFDQTGTLYTIQTGAGVFPFGTVDTGTGVFTPIANVSGDVPAEVTGLTIAGDGTTAYMSSATNLYSLDLASGAASLVGPFGAGVTLMIDVAMSCAGDMYGHAIDTDSLYSIDPATGAATLIGTHGLAANFAQGMDFDDSGDLYAAIYTGGGTYTYGTFDLGTGALNPLSTQPPTGEWEVAIPASCGPALAVQTGAATIADVCSSAPGQENGIVEPGETLQISVPVAASGGNFTDVVASLPLPAPAGITYIVSEAQLGDLNDGDNATANFEVLVDPGFACLTSFTQPIAVIAAEGSASGSIDVDVGTAGAPTFTPLAGTGPGVAIPDNSPAGITSTLSIAENVSIYDLRVVVNATHTWVGDVKISLTSPGGTTVQLLDQPGVPGSTFGCSVDNIAALFGDGFAPNEDVCPGTSPWPGASPEIAPTDPLAAFSGESTVGDWVLTISDNASGDTGALDSWSLQVAEGPGEQTCTVCAGNDVIFADGFDP